MSDEAFESYLTRWREADPWRASAWRFLQPVEQIRFGALAALFEEWRKAIREVSEAQIAAVKLGWWREEMQHAAQGEARHPLTQALFADAKVRAVPLACWVAAVDAALLAVAVLPASDASSQCEAERPLAQAFAELETRVWFGPRVQSPRAATTTVFVHLTANLRALDAELGHGRSPLPMNLLARHGLSIDQLGVDGSERRAALRDYVVVLEQGLANAATMDGPLSLFSAVRARRDLRALQRARRADDPLQALLSPAHGLRELLKIWQLARIWRKAIDNETTP